MKWLIGLVLPLTLSCSPAQLQQASTDHPALAPTTQKLEIVLQQGDKAAQTAQTVGTDVQAAGSLGTALGIPYSGWATIAGGVIAGLAGLWLRQRGLTSDATGAAVTIATAAHDEKPVGLTPALASAISAVTALSPTVGSAINAAIPPASTTSN